MRSAATSLQKPPGFDSPNEQSYLPPARKPGIPRTYRPRKKSNCCRTFCCYTYIVLLILIFFLAAITCMLYLWYDPKVPVVRLQSVEFPQLNITGNSDESTIKIQAVARVGVKNPNHVISVNFDKTDVTFKVGELDLGTATLPAFNQPNKKTTSLKLTTPEKELTMDTMTAKELIDGIKSKNVMIATVVKTGVGVSADFWTTPKQSVKAHCRGMSIRSIQGGDAPKCEITILEVVHFNT